MILDTLAAASKDAGELIKKYGLNALRREAEALPQVNRGFGQALKKQGLSFICEVKKASPSKGLIAKNFNPVLQARVYPVLQARAYEKAGAAAVSCLTEPQYFLGSNEYLKAISQSISLPVLRKDFTVHEAQIYEAKLIGADAILLITALLQESVLHEYLAAAKSIGLDVLTEVHDEAELETAMKAGAEIIGVNNRNLKDFTVDFNNSLRLKKLVPPGITFVAESGIKTRDDIIKLQNAGADAVLIGETLMRSSDAAGALKQLAGVE